MKHRVLRQNDCAQYSDDLFQCFKDNPQILDEESIDYFESLEKSVNYVEDLIGSPDSMVVGIFDDDEEFLYGIVIFDQMRFSKDGNSAQLHIAIYRDYQELLLLVGLLICPNPSNLQYLLGG